MQNRLFEYVNLNLHSDYKNCDTKRQRVGGGGSGDLNSAYFDTFTVVSRFLMLVLPRKCELNDFKIGH